MLAQLRSQIATLASVAPPARKSLGRLRQEQSDLEENLFVQPPEQRAHIKKSLAELRVEISAAEKAELPEVKPETPGESGGPTQVA